MTDSWIRRYPIIQISIFLNQSIDCIGKQYFFFEVKFEKNVCMWTKDKNNQLIVPETGQMKSFPDKYQ